MGKALFFEDWIKLNEQVNSNNIKNTKKETLIDPPTNVHSDMAAYFLGRILKLKIGEDGYCVSSDERYQHIATDLNTYYRNYKKII